MPARKGPPPEDGKNYFAKHELGGVALVRVVGGRERRMWLLHGEVQSSAPRVDPWLRHWPAEEGPEDPGSPPSTIADVKPGQWAVYDGYAGANIGGCFHTLAVSVEHGNEDWHEILDAGPFETYDEAEAARVALANEEAAFAGPNEGECPGGRGMTPCDQGKLRNNPAESLYVNTSRPGTPIIPREERS